MRRGLRLKTQSSLDLLGMLSNLMEPRGRIQGVIQVFNDVLRMFKSDAEPDRFDAYACSTLFVGGHLPVGR